MTMRLRPAPLMVALLVVTACQSGAVVATSEPIATSAPLTVAPSTTTVLDADTAMLLEKDEARIFVAYAYFDARNAYDVEAATALFGPKTIITIETSSQVSTCTRPSSNGCAPPAGGGRMTTVM